MAAVWMGLFLALPGCLEGGEGHDFSADISAHYEEEGNPAKRVQIIEVLQRYRDSYRSPGDGGTTTKVKADVEFAAGGGGSGEYSIFVADSDGWTVVSVDAFTPLPDAAATNVSPSAAVRVLEPTVAPPTPSRVVTPTPATAAPPTPQPPTPTSPPPPSPWVRDPELFLDLNATAHVQDRTRYQVVGVARGIHWGDLSFRTRPTVGQPEASGYLLVYDANARSNDYHGTYCVATTGEACAATPPPPEAEIVVGAIIELDVGGGSAPVTPGGYGGYGWFRIVHDATGTVVWRD